MKIFLFALILLSNIVAAQTFTTAASSDADQTSTLQAAYNDAATYTVVINRRIVLNGKLTIPEGKVLKFEAGGKIAGNGTITGGLIEANYQNQIFDTSVTVNLKKVNQYFSARWFGATGDGSDDYAAIQKSIYTCIRNNIRTVFIPVGRYHISKPLIIRGGNSDVDDQRGFCTLELLGESSFWDSNVGTEIHPDFKNTFAIGIQDGKGCKLRKLKIMGLFTPPYTHDLKRFFNTSFENFTDSSCRDSRYSPYAAVVIDPFTNLRADPLPSDGGYPGLASYYGKANGLSGRSGSTGTEIEELSIESFVIGICSSPNGITRNAEITLINKIQFENCKLCISGGEDQEKGNTISNIYCWGGTHTIFATGLYGSVRQAGNWNIDHANLAGSVVRFIYNDQHGYFPTYISHVFAENLGTWGTINSELACEISDCHIDFTYPDVAGNLTLLSSWGENIVYRNCNFRYYGQKTPLIIEGNAVFDHCYFSGSVIKPKENMFPFFGLLKKPINGNLILALATLLVLVTGLIWYAVGYKKNRQLQTA